MKVAVSEGPAFFIRTDYLLHVAPNALCAGAEFAEADNDDILDAGFCYAAERKAVSYLTRTEQSRFILTKKLLAKKIELKYILRALDYLEKIGLLSDARYARAWLTARKIHHCEGRTRLAAELASRGVSQHVARSALDNFFAENSEHELCCRALEKCLRQNKSREKIYARLSQLGFSQKLIKHAFEHLPIQDKR